MGQPTPVKVKLFKVCIHNRLWTTIFILFGPMVYLTTFALVFSAVEYYSSWNT